MCGTDSAYLYVNVSDGRGQESEEEEQLFNAYPNPVDNILTVEINRQARQQTAATNLSYDIRLYDSFGILVRQATLKGSNVKLNVANLLNGIYFLHIYDGLNVNPEIHKIVVKH